MLSKYIVIDILSFVYNAEQIIKICYQLAKKMRNINDII